ncbi:MAG TPA: deoxyguanosinetriphosphate triphosphohydrolase, partial [Pseudothauera hydrothermalis]|nr:deoxyguanosinetriphosphate triphosphohydrolase [Pseudothauera hydrothermalis]
FLDGTQPSLEAQLANLADEIAYNNHDVDDGLRSGLITLEQLEAVPVFADNRREVERLWPGLAGRRLIHETIRRMINQMVLDLIAQTRANIAAARVESLADVRAAPRLVAYSDQLRPRLQVLKTFLRDNLYHHYQVLRMTDKARRIVRDLFDAFMADPRLLPPQYQRRAADDKPRAIADYIAGMTDRYAIKEHRRLFAVGEIH